MHEAGDHIGRSEIGQAFNHLMQQDHRRFGSARGIVWRHRAGIGREAIIDQLGKVIVLAKGVEPLKTADTDMPMAEAYHDGRARGRWFVIALQRLARFNHGEGLAGVDAQRLQHFGRQDFPHRAFQRQPSVTEPAVGCLARSLGAKVQQAPRAVSQLCEQKAAAIPDLRVVNPELMPVITQSQGLGQIAVQRCEPCKMRAPSRIVEPVKAHRRVPAPVAEADQRLRKIGRRDRIGQPGGKHCDFRIGGIQGGLRFDAHHAIVRTCAAWRKRRYRQSFLSRQGWPDRHANILTVTGPARTG